MSAGPIVKFHYSPPPPCALTDIALAFFLVTVPANESCRPAAFLSPLLQFSGMPWQPLPGHAECQSQCELLT